MRVQGEIEHQNEHPSQGECGPDGAWGVGGSLSGIPSPLSGVPSPYVVSHSINESPKWNSSLFDIFDFRGHQSFLLGYEHGFGDVYPGFS